MKCILLVTYMLRIVAVSSRWKELLAWVQFCVYRAALWRNFDNTEEEAFLQKNLKLILGKAAWKESSTKWILSTDSALVLGTKKTAGNWRKSECALHLQMHVVPDREQRASVRKNNSWRPYSAIINLHCGDVTANTQISLGPNVKLSVLNLTVRTVASSICMAKPTVTTNRPAIMQ